MHGPRTQLVIAISSAIALALIGGYAAWTPGLPLIDDADRGCEPDLARMVAPGCPISATDTGVGKARQLWGRIECESPKRHRRVRPGGDRWPRANGTVQRDRSYRRLAIRDGDDYFGRRCELGRNEHRNGEGGRDGTFALFNEGERRITFVSLRLPRSFPLRSRRWQTVVQMKQAQPYADAGDTGPVLELQIRKGALHLYSSWRHLWSTPVRRGRWIRIALDVTYSSDPDRGSVTAYVGRAGVRRSPTFRVATLKRERAGSGLLPVGTSVPSHLRVGLYHDPGVRCPSRGCAIHIDNVEVTAPIEG